MCILLTLDIIECNASVAVCDENADCNDTDGSFECVCRRGFSGDGFTCDGNDCCTCTLHIFNVTIDMDECALGTDNCNTTISECFNTNGGFDCICRMGFNMTTDQDCIRKYNITYHVFSFLICLFS